jgi:hypothetical protein
VTGTLSGSETDSYIQQYRLLTIKQKVMKDEYLEADKQLRQVNSDLNQRQQSVAFLSKEKADLMV